MKSGMYSNPLKLDDCHGRDSAESQVKLTVPFENSLIRGLQSGEEVPRQYACNLAQKISARSKAFFCLLIRRRNRTE